MGDARAVAALDAISHSNTAFSVDLYKVLGNEPGNLFFSPLSIQVVLALVYFGAKGNTAKELQRGLHLPSDKMITDNGINALMHRLNVDLQIKPAPSPRCSHGHDLAVAFQFSSGPLLRGRFAYPSDSLGMGSMFDAGGANLSGIGDRHLLVSKVIHKAFIEVNERGTEAAAATRMKNAKFIPDVSVLVGGGLGGFPPIVFKADHPYTFFIVDDFTKTVLFAGRLASPSM
ncbi:leukocyte elastase inhibitor-like [Schistocerca serialis cubense]|uniref:leukocyte elastase inhibitor-like n=1 Tax=Schistocerca serialis cubense TaxID=2023355 RepID=UPI00214F2DA8|nr:leukocyte elastase inhibitor-like [Schistocerca serialis cubense]